MPKKDDKDLHVLDLGAVPVHLYLALSQKAFDVLLHNLDQKPDGPFILPGTCGATHIYPKSDTCDYAFCVICLTPPKRLGVDFAGLVAHEASHVVDFCFEAMREDKPGEEIRAYMIQYIVQNVLELCFKKRK